MTTATNNLGRLKRVELREVWANEAGDFTPWLAQEDNIALLGDTIGLDLEVEGQEMEVGPFRADILCKDTASGNWVLVENQLEKTDHTYLGQLMTYAAGLKAVTIVWIADRFRAYIAAAARAGTTAADGTSVSFDQLDGRAFIVASDGTYLGSINSNGYQSKSIMNEHGSHGSRYGSTSIYNNYCQYGGSRGRHSPFNTLASDPPRVYRDKEFVGFLTINKFKSPRIDPYALIGYLKTK